MSKKKAVSTKKIVTVYTFGVGGRLVEGEEQVATALHLAHRYRNALIGVERARRQGIRDATMAVSETAQLQERYEQLDARVREIYNEMKRERSTARTRKVSAASKADLQLAKEHRKNTAAELKEAKRTHAASLKTVYDQTEQCARDATRKVIEAERTELFWPTYKLVEEAAKNSRNALMRKKLMGAKNDPRFRPRPRPYGGRADGIAEGRIGILVAGNKVTVADAFSGKSPWLRISPIDPAVYHLPRGERRKLTRATFSFRVGTKPKSRAPIFATLTDVIIHRELPADGLITVAWLKLHMEGDRVSDRKWQLQLTVESQNTERQRALAHPEPAATAAINVGWRDIDGDKRVAYLVDNDGHSESIVYSARPRARRRVLRAKDGHRYPTKSTPSDGDRFAHGDSLKAIRARSFDLARDTLVAYLQSGAPVGPVLQEHASHLAQWRSSSRLASLVRQWNAERVAGDEATYDQMFQWLKQDAHLYQWETRERARAQRARKEHYRQIAHRLCRRYGKIIVGSADLKQVAQRKRIDDSEDDATNEMRKRRARVAPGEFMAALRLFASKTSTVIVDAKTHHITDACHACGGVCEWDRAKNLEHTCEHCGTHWDQDENACRNLLRAHGAKPPTARKSRPTRDRKTIATAAE